LTEAQPLPDNRPLPDSSKSVVALTWEELSSICEGLHFAQRPLRAAAQGVMRQYSLGPRGAWILGLISKGMIYPLELSNMFKAGRSLITAELARLTEARLITASVGKHDRRRSELALTPLGMSVAKRVSDEIERIVRRNLAEYSAEEIRLFMRMLHDVQQVDDSDATDCC
jgi:DNA-binding MarR family transcriptional regulator